MSSAGLTFYTAKVLVPDVDPLLPSEGLIYKVKPFITRTPTAHGAPPALHSSSAASSGGAATAAATRLENLEKEQRALLDGLQSLQKKVASYASSPTCAATAPAARSGGNKPFTPTTHDVVVQTSQAHPPLATLAVALMLEEQGANIAVRHFWHSSNVKPVPAGFVQKHRGEGAHNVDTRVSFVWGNAAVPKSVVHFSPIEGDVNIAKLLCRLHSPSLLQENDVLAATHVDAWLARVQAATTPARVAELQKQVAAGLAKTSAFLCGSTLTLADVAAWARLRGSLASDSNVKTLLTSISNQSFGVKALSWQ